MKYSPKGPTPEALADWLALENACWQPRYNNFQAPQKPAVHLALLREQGGVCAYCGRSLSFNCRDSHIDHFWPQTAFGPGSGNDKTLDYANFFASCVPPVAGNSHEKQAPTCGDAKGSWFDTKHYVIPSDPGCEQRFRFLPSGEVGPKQKLDIGAINMIEALNLDERALSLERSTIIQALENDIANNQITARNKGDEILRWRTPDVAGRLKSFGHVAARYLEDENLT